MSKYTTIPLETVGNLVRTNLTEGGFLIADCRGSDGQPHSEEAKANARLFSAAPDLLEALQKFVAWSAAENDHKGTTFWERVEMLRELDACADSAILKATGEQA